MTNEITEEVSQELNEEDLGFELLKASKAGDIELVKKYIELGVSPQERDVMGYKFDTCIIKWIFRNC